jgi:RNA polymerase sigma-70 factor (ECF subfamily)
VDEWHTNRDAIASAIAGDRDALRTVWAEHRRWVAAILLAHKPRQADLEDLLQTVAVQMCRKAHEVRDPDAFRPWLRMVAINIARAEGRGTTRKRQGFLRLVGRTPAEAEAESAPPAPEQIERVREAERLMALARDLPEGYREPLLMRCLKGMSYREIGEAMDLPETTIETRIARGRRMLRELASSTETAATPLATGTA